MNEVFKYPNSLSIKLVLGGILSLFSPFAVELAVLITMIAIDTITGSAYAVKINKFSSSGLRRGLKKVFFYSLCILVVRLLEIGISSIISTNMLTNLVVGFLIFTEAISALENLTLLGVPLPAGISKFLIKQIKGTPLSDLVLSSSNRREYIDEINDMVDFNLPNISDEDIKRLLEIKFNEWAQLVNYFDVQFDNLYSSNNEILFFRVSSLINATMNKISDRWSTECVPEHIVTAFSDWHNPRVTKWIDGIKLICLSDIDMNMKKAQIIEKLLVALYQTLIDIRKVEFFKK